MMPSNEDDRDTKLAIIMSTGNATVEEAAQALDDNNTRRAIEQLYGKQQAKHSTTTLPTTNDDRNHLDKHHHHKRSKQHKKRKSSSQSSARRASSQQPTDGDETRPSTATASRTTTGEENITDRDAKMNMILKSEGNATQSAPLAANKTCIDADSLDGTCEHAKFMPEKAPVPNYETRGTKIAPVAITVPTWSSDEPPPNNALSTTPRLAPRPSRPVFPGVVVAVAGTNPELTNDEYSNSFYLPDSKNSHRACHC